MWKIGRFRRNQAWNLGVDPAALEVPEPCVDLRSRSGEVGVDFVADNEFRVSSKTSRGFWIIFGRSKRTVSGSDATWDI